MTGIPVFRLVLHLLGGGLLLLGCSLAASSAARAQSGQTAGEMWDGVFRRMPDVPDTSGSFPARCVERALAEGLLKQGSKALVLAMGDGRHALQFARQGLDVTALDISTVAIEKARKAAADLGVKLTIVQADLFKHDLGDGQWDLVTNIYFNPAIQTLDRIKKAVRPGGLLLIEGYGSDHKGGGPPPWSRYKPNQLLAALGDFRILTYEDGLFVSDWAGNRKVPVVRVLARKPLR